MGRSRTVFHSSDDDPNQSRSKRKKAVSDLEILQPGAAGQETNEYEGKKGLYHCNYCNKDISEYIRIKCAVCPDFDLCVECFSVGAELTPHKSNHPYRVMDNLSFPLICPDWSADEEMLLIEGIGMYGISNWTVVAEHVGTKSRQHCIDHYNAIYMNSPCYPLPDMSHIKGKTREDLLAMAKVLGEDMKGSPSVEELTVKVEPSSSASFKIEDQMEGVSTVQPSSDISPGELGTGIGSGLSVNAGKRVSEVKDGRDIIKVEDSHSERSIGGKKLRISGDKRHSVTERSGYNSKRQEFEVEYDNDAEQLLADMEFKDTDTEAERAVKLRVLHIYSKTLDERKRRKDFILERNLLYPDPFEIDLSPEEREICRRYRVFMRYNTKEEHEELLNSIIEEHRTMRRIQDLQEARAAGCCTSAQAERFIEEKRKKEAEESARKLKDGAHGSPSGRYFQRATHLKVEPDNSPRGNVRGSVLADSGGKDSSSSAGQAVSHSSDNWDIRGFPGADLLSETEKQLCGEIKILPSHYLSILQTLETKVGDGSIKEKPDAHALFNVDPSKVDRIYDMLAKKGISAAP